MKSLENFIQKKNVFIYDIKSKIINLFRIPLKYIDIINTKNAHKVLVNSNYSKNKLDKIYNINTKILTMPLLYHNNQINFKRKNFYLTIGSTSYFKGIDFIINSISILPAKYRYPLIIVGNKGRNHNKIINLAKNKGIKIIQHYNIDKGKIINLYKQAKLLLAAAHNEPFGLSLIESLLYGLPVLAVKEGGYIEIIDNYIKENNYGFLSKRNPSEFSSMILKLLKIKKTEDIKISEYILDKYDIKKTINELNNLFKTV